MNSFHIQNRIPPLAANKIGHGDKLLALGSCFSEHMGGKLRYAGFDVEVNPMGVLFNPASIAIALRAILEDKVFDKGDMFQQGSLWASWKHSTLFSSADVQTALHNINARVRTAHQQLVQADVILITLGTAWVFTLKSAGEVVANCHKMPPNLFERRRLSVHEIVADLRDVSSQIKKINPKVQLLFTVSPVRHLKDGVHENTLSKSVLHLAVDQLCEELDFAHYFPAYEILMDELRDYRFYAEDMVHPSNQAVDYIWERFMDFSMSPETIAISKEIEAFKRMENHRPIHQDTPEYQQFLQSLQKKKQELMEQYSFLEDRPLE